MFEAWGLTSFFGNGKVPRRMILFGIIWLVWLERNACIFMRSLIPKEDIAHLALRRITMWASFRDDFDNFSVGGILQN